MLDIAATDRTPRVWFDASVGQMLISGESWPENVAIFYGQISQALTDYFAAPAVALDVHIQLRYFNSGSARALGDLMRQLDQGSAGQHRVNLIWHYDKGDDIGLEFAEDISEQLRHVDVLIKEAEHG